MIHHLCYGEGNVGVCDACMYTEEAQWYVMVSSICVCVLTVFAKQEHAQPRAQEVMTRNDLFYGPTKSHHTSCRLKVSQFNLPPKSI